MIAIVADHLWQSTVVAAVVALLARALRRNRPQVRYALWLAASVKFLVSFAALVALGAQVGGRSGAVAAPPFAVVIDSWDAIGQPFSRPAPIVAPSATVVAAVFPLMLLAGWLCGCVAIVATWSARWRRIAAAARTAAPVQHGRELEMLARLERAAGITRPIALVSSDGSLEPGVFGIWTPVLLWPRSIANHLDERQVEAILAHEVMHVRRRDNLAAAMHMVVQALFWFHPLVWWIGARLVDERERACDADVIRLGSDPRVYAESILAMCQFYVDSPLVCVAGVTGSDAPPGRLTRGHPVRRHMASVRQRSPRWKNSSGSASRRRRVPSKVWSSIARRSRCRTELREIDFRSRGLTGDCIVDRSRRLLGSPRVWVRARRAESEATGDLPDPVAHGLDWVVADTVRPSPRDVSIVRRVARHRARLHDLQS